jgi:hypothetical protein
VARLPRLTLYTFDVIRWPKCGLDECCQLHPHPILFSSSRSRCFRPLTSLPAKTLNPNRRLIKSYLLKLIMQRSATLERGSAQPPEPLCDDEELCGSSVPTSNTSHLKLALQASESLRLVADTLCKDNSCIQFCSSLKAILLEIITWLRTLRESSNAMDVILELLDELESLCKV